MGELKEKLSETEQEKESLKDRVETELKEVKEKVFGLEMQIK